MKRSAAIVIVSAGLSLAACGDSTNTYTNISDCVAHSSKTISECKDLFSNAVKEHEKTAPKFATKESCEAEFGAGKCDKPTTTQPTQQVQAPTGSTPSGSSDSNSWFVPAMMGFMAGNLMNNHSSAPVYYRNNGSPYMDNRYGSSSRVAPSQNFTYRNPQVRNPPAPSYAPSRSSTTYSAPASSRGGAYGSTGSSFSSGS